VVEPERPRALVHQPHERALGARDALGERRRRVVARPDQQAAQQVADGHAVAGLQVDQRLAHDPVVGDGAVGVVEVGALEREQGGHQLHGRADRALGVGAAFAGDDTRRDLEHDRVRGLDRGWAVARVRRRGRRECGRDGDGSRE
jgi:hypothetical protein